MTLARTLIALSPPLPFLLAPGRDLFRYRGPSAEGSTRTGQRHVRITPVRPYDWANEADQ